jgi:hypothetical protein
VAHCRVTWDWNADGDRKSMFCNWSYTKVLAVPTALTLIVNIICSAVFGLV